MDKNKKVFHILCIQLSQNANMHYTKIWDTFSLKIGPYMDLIEEVYFNLSYFKTELVI